jgi:cytochrome P450
MLEPIIRNHPDFVGNNGVIQRTTMLLAILLVIAIYIYRKISQTFHSLNEKMNRSEVVPGFPSRPGAHWLVGHLVVLRGAEVQVVRNEKRKGKANKLGVSKSKGTEEEDEKPVQVSTNFVAGYQRVYCDHADPKTGRGSFWFFHIPCVSLLRGKDARKVMRSSSYRKPVWLLNMHTRELLGQKTLLALMNKEWRYYRSAVHKSFTSEVVKESRPFIYQIGNTLTDSLLGLIAQNELLKEAEDESISDSFSEDATLPSSNPLPTPGESCTTGHIHILPLMKMATIDVFGLVALRSNGVDFGCTRNLKLSPLASAFDHLTTDYTARLKRPWDPLSFMYSLPTKTNRDYRRKRSKIRKFVLEQITQSRARIAKLKTNMKYTNCPKGEYDLLTNLVSAADSEMAKSEQESNMDEMAHDEALGDILMTLLFAGYDTTSISLSYALYLLAKNPTKKARCLAEIDAVIGRKEMIDGMLPPGPEELPYTKAVILETLRLFPPAPSTARTIEKPTTISCDGLAHRKAADCSDAKEIAEPCNGNENKTLTLSEGQMVMLPIWSIQRSELNYPRPNEMIPERWVRRNRKIQSTCHDIDSETRSLWEMRPEDDNQKDGAVGCHDLTSSSNFVETEEKDDDGDDTIPPANREAFCAFAAGARNCVGKNLAVEESVILLSCLLHKLTFELVSETYEVSPSLHAVVQQPEDDLPMIVRPRR